MRLGMIVRDQCSCCLCQWKATSKNEHDLEELLVYHLTAETAVGGHGRSPMMICKGLLPRRRGVTGDCWEFTGPRLPRGWSREFGR